jgi:hypothetical protein
MAFYPVQPLPDTNARTPTITVRPASTALLTIDSEDRYKDYLDARANPTSPYNFTIRKNENLMAGFFTRLAVTEINFPWTIPNINIKTSEMVFAIEPSGQPVVVSSIDLNFGFYTPADLASEITTQISAVLPGFIMTYSNPYGPVLQQVQNPRFEYDCSEGDKVAFFPYEYNSAAYPWPPQTKQLFDLMGFTTIQETLVNSGTGTYTLCQAIRYVDIVANVLTSVSSLKDQTSQPIVRDMLCRVYLGDGGGTGQSTTKCTAVDISGITNAFCPPGCAPTTIYRNFTNPKQIQWLPNQNIPGSINFQVYDDAGDILSNSLITPGSNIGREQTIDWSMTILVTEN